MRGRRGPFIWGWGFIWGLGFPPFGLFSVVQGRVLVVDAEWRGVHFRFINVYYYILGWVQGGGHYGGRDYLVQFPGFPQ